MNAQRALIVDRERGPETAEHQRRLGRTRVQIILAGELKAQLAAPYSNRLVVVDLRSPTETARGVIPQSINVPASEISRAHLRGLAAARRDDIQLVFVCNDETRSRMVAQTAMKAGAENVAILRGGVAGWREAGYETVPAYHPHLVSHLPHAVRTTHHPFKG